MERYSEKVGAFVRGLVLDDLPSEVREKAKLIVLDTLGIALASSTMDFGHMVLDVARVLGGARESRLIGTQQKVAAANAVLANGTLAHGLDYDDTLEEAIVHTSVWRSWEKVGRFAGSPSSPILAARSLILIWTALLS